MNQIARQLKEKNIAEYLIYMWQEEDLIRANHGELEEIDRGECDRPLSGRSASCPARVVRQPDRSESRRLKVWHATGVKNQNTKRWAKNGRRPKRP